MNLVTRTTEYPNGVKIIETFQDEPNINQNFSAPYDQAACTGGFDSRGDFVHDGDTCPVHESEPHIVTFMYDGVVRTVQEPQIIRGAHARNGFNALLGGVELTRDYEATGVYKNFSLSRIQPV